MGISSYSVSEAASASTEQSVIFTSEFVQFAMCCGKDPAEFTEYGVSSNEPILTALMDEASHLENYIFRNEAELYNGIYNDWYESDTSNCYSTDEEEYIPIIRNPTNTRRPFMRTVRAPVVESEAVLAMLESVDRIYAELTNVDNSETDDADDEDDEDDSETSKTSTRRSHSDDDSDDENLPVLKRTKRVYDFKILE